MNPKTFIFESYEYEAESRKIRLRYSFDDEIKFEEVLELPEGASGKVPSNLLERALFNLHLIAGISYYKAYCPNEIVIRSGALSEEEARFWNDLYTQGLGEFFYENELDFRGLVNFPAESEESFVPVKYELPNRSLVPLGGGKDSIVACHLLEKIGEDFDLFNMGGYQVTKDVAEIMGKDLIVTKRSLDEVLFLLNEQGAYNGHIPISAYIGFLSVVMCLLYGYDRIVLANEASANFGNVEMHGMEVNHQYSKSLEFELDLSGYLTNFLTPNIVYLSLLRPWYELRIAKEFANLTEFHHAATSCNRNFKVRGDGPESRWCGECPKCAFVFAILAPFMEKDRLVEMFKKNMFADATLTGLYDELLGVKDIKPFECVGTPDEVRTAMKWVKERGDYEGDIIIDGFDLEPERKDLMVFHKHHQELGRFQQCFEQNLLILGYGQEGKSVYEYMQKALPKVKIGVADMNEVDHPDNVSGHLGADYLEALPHYDVIVKSPGIPWQPEFKSHEERITSATQMFFWELNPSNTVIAITGSKGKSTTASLMAAVAKTSGMPVYLVGNIGEPMLKFVDVKDSIIVAELSSYQLEHLQFNPDVAILTSLFPDHLDYHGSFENYLRAKAQICFSQVPSGVFVYHKKYEQAKDFMTRANRLEIGDYEKVETKLPGEHNQDNIALVRTAAGILGWDLTKVDEVIANFDALVHRLETVRTLRGVTYIDDANATTPEGTLAALAAFKGQIGTIFLGGKDRGYDFSKLGAELAEQEIQNVVLFPESGDAIRNAWPEGYEPVVFETDSMKAGVTWASENTEDGKVVMLSMASPSYGLFKNYKDKGEQFQAAVNQLQ